VAFHAGLFHHVDAGPVLAVLRGLQYLDPTRAIVTACLERYGDPADAIILGELVSPMQVVGIAWCCRDILVQRPDRKAPPNPIAVERSSKLSLRSNLGVAVLE